MPEDRELLARAYHDYEAAVKAARALWSGAPENILREAAADFLIHVRELRRTGNAATGAVPQSPTGEAPPACPICRDAMKDKRGSKTNPRQPDYKCTNRACDGAVWLDRKPNRSPTRNGGTA